MTLSRVKTIGPEVSRGLTHRVAFSDIGESPRLWRIFVSRYHTMTEMIHCSSFAIPANCASTPRGEKAPLSGMGKLRTRRASRLPLNFAGEGRRETAHFTHVFPCSLLGAIRAQ